MNTKSIGDISEVMVMAALLRCGAAVLKPVGDNQRYDLVVDLDGCFSRVQCKTGRLKDGRIAFPTCSSYAHRGRVGKGYLGEADVFGIYCPENDRVYLVPVEQCGGRMAHLRCDPTKNGQTSGVRLASEYEVSFAK